MQLLLHCLEMNPFEGFGFLYFLTVLSKFKTAQSTPLPSTHAELRTVLVKSGIFSYVFFFRKCLLLCHAVQKN